MSTWLNGRVSGLVRACAVALVAGVVAFSAPRADAQMMGGNPFEKPVLMSDIDKLVRLVKLDDDQAQQAKDLLASFDQEHQAAAKKLQESMQEIQQEYQDSRDPAVFQDMVKQMFDFQAHAEKLRDALFADIKLLLDEKQLQSWDRWERRYRRDHSMRAQGGSGIISGDSVELVTMVEDLKLTDEQRQPLDALLDQYEAEMDRVVIARKKLQDEQTKQTAEIMNDWMGNMPKLEEMFSKGRDLLVQVREINAKYVRQIMSALPEDKKPEFETAYNAKALPQVFRKSYVTNAFETAKGMEDLSADQQAQVAELRATYEREAAAANQKWASEIRDYEVGMKLEAMMSAGGRPESLTAAQQARRDLDSATYDKLAAMLSEEQRAKLPKKGGGMRGPSFGE